MAFLPKTSLGTTKNLVGPDEGDMLYRTNKIHNSVRQSEWEGVEAFFDFLFLPFPLLCHILHLPPFLCSLYLSFLFSH